MGLSNLKEVLEKILRDNKGVYVLPYQICEELKKNYKYIWEELNKRYPSAKIGAGAGSNYTVATHIAKTLSDLTRDGEIKGLEQAELCVKDITINGIQPSPSQITLGIWKINQS